MQLDHFEELRVQVVLETLCMRSDFIKKRTVHSFVERLHQFRYNMFLVMLLVFLQFFKLLLYLGLEFKADSFNIST